MLARSNLDPALLFCALMMLLAAIVAAYGPSSERRRPPQVATIWAMVGLWSGGGVIATSLLAHRIGAALPAGAAYAALSGILATRFQRFNVAGALWVASQILSFVVTLVWGVIFVAESGFPTWFQGYLYVSIGLGSLAAVPAIVSSVAREAALTHREWRYPTVAPRRARDAAEPRVSLQLPCYAEPPEIVMTTMDRLAALEYRNFEVLVFDNNTREEELWRPLQSYCEVLNRKLGREVFRFFHVAPLEGAKAGALNRCLEVMDPTAEFVGVIDADYQANRDFLSRLVPFFADARLGYIQTPHDYHGYRRSPYLTACYWEYMPVNKLDWCGVSEYGGAFTIGTMCLLRTDALRKAGGWAEWCLTEDSEISVRLRAVGYSGLYFAETFGRGLIPETFDDYRKQRFRWTAGPVQQLARHWRKFLPAPFAPALPGWSKLLEITRCSAPLQKLVALVAAMVGTLSLGIVPAATTGRHFDVPNIGWCLLLLGAGTWGVRTVHRYRHAGCFDLSSMVLGEIARASLGYVVLLAGVAGLARRPLAWRRTPKFALSGRAPSAFEVARGETIAGMTCFALAAAMPICVPAMGFEVALLFALQMLGLGAMFFCAPLMAWMAERHAEKVRRAGHSAQHSFSAIAAVQEAR